ncbi:DNA polymerase III subunit delta [Hyphomicrobium sp. 99]|uniref:DNA polymerase III subunit delta n=1 Tax=Hyphomicrobium sp. 99 TaxID=1163419 RepID=UPI0005F7E370|nr:DNA polymerase III subunit delta [Hyphomicrobium sp. 99]
MVAVKPQQAPAFMKAPPADLAAALFHGSDPGLVSERAAALAKSLAARQNPPGEILKIDETELDEDPGRLETELQTRPMFSGRRIVRAIASRRVSTALLKPLLTSGPLEGLLVVEAGNLKADDSLRSLFESQAGCFAVACYPDSAADIDTLISEVLASFSLKIEGDARALLQSRLGADRALSRAEIEKLALFCLGRPSITHEDVENLVGDAAGLALERIAEAVAEGRTKDAISDFGRALASGENAQVIILIVQRYFLKLHRVRSDVDGGLRLDDALKSIRPPLFFKQKDSFGRQVRSWSRGQLDQALRRIAEAAKTARLTSSLEDVVAERLILALASMAAMSSAAAGGR